MVLALCSIAAIYILAFQIGFLDRFSTTGRLPYKIATIGRLPYEIATIGRLPGEMATTVRDTDNDSTLHKWATELRNRNIPLLPCGTLHKPERSRIMTERSSNHMSENSIVIFTTFRNVSDRFTIQKNTINNWSQYRPVVQPVLFDDHTDPGLLDLAVNQGWHVLPFPASTHSLPPRVKLMYGTVGARYPNATYIGWSNADILFDVGLLVTLDFVQQFHSTLNWTLVTGGRYNMYNVNNHSVSDTDEVRELIAGNTTGKLTIYAEDYFFLYKNMFPWDSILDEIVVGKPGVDNYLVAMAAMRGVSVVDASCSVGALHQMDKNGTNSSMRSKDSYLNKKLIDAAFPYQKGRLNQIKYYTTTSETWHIRMNIDLRVH